MPITLTITACTAEELNTELRGLVNAIEQQQEVKVEKVPVVKEKSVPTKTVKEEAPKAVTPREEPKSEAKEKTVTASVTLEDLRAKAKEVAKEKGKPALKTLLDEFEAASITALEKGKYGSFLEALEEALNE